MKVVAHMFPAPYQDNSYNCGVFVCCYVYAFYMLCHSILTVADHDSPAEALRKAITERNQFKSDKSNIVQIREEIKILITKSVNQHCITLLNTHPPTSKHKNCM
jgi:hypothetical protein